MEKFGQMPSAGNGQENESNMESLEANLLKAKTSLESGELNPEKKKKLTRVLGKFLKTVRNIALAGSVLAVANHERTHDDLSIETSNNEKVYSHPDAQTTHILNVLAGKESVTEDDLLMQIRNMMVRMGEKVDTQFDKSPNEMSIDELDAAYVSLNPNSKSGELRAVFQEEMRDVKEDSKYLREEGREKEIYDLIWKMEEECGNPRIRFSSEDAGFSPIGNFEGNSHYDPINNVVYMDMTRLYDNMTGYQDRFFGEMAHAKQFNDQQIGSYLQQISDFAHVFKDGGFDMGKLSESYHDLYKTPGTVEHEAHALIEPYLRDKFGEHFISRKERKENESHDHE